MPKSHDLRIIVRCYVKDVKTGSITYYDKSVGGGWRNWQGDQNRPRPSVLTPTPCSSTSKQYYSTLMLRKNQFIEAYMPRSFFEGSLIEKSEDDAQGAGKAQNAAINRLQKGHLNVLVALGESKETVTYVASRMFTLYRTLKLISRGRFGEAAKVLRSDLSQNASKRLRRNRDRYKNPTDLLANSWLEYQFGIKPLVNDIYGAIDAYHQKLQAGTAVKSKGKYQSGSNGTTYRAGYTATVKNPTLRTLQQLGITNPALAAWELVPLSFVIDWFLPIGNLLQYLDATVGLTNVYGWGSKKSWLREYAKNPKSLENAQETYSRYVSIGVLPALTVGSNLNIGQVTTASALLQRLKR